MADIRREHTRAFMSDPAWFEDRAKGLVEMHRGALPNALAQIRAWHPAFADSSDDEIAAAPFTVDDARLVYARQHGRRTWDELLASVVDLVCDSFAAAFRAMRLRHDAYAEARLRGIISRDPSVVNARGTNGNTLLNLGVAAGNTACVCALLAAGADPNIANERGWTPLHQAAVRYSVPDIDLLLDAGASPTISAHGDGGTPLAVALLWGNTAAAARLAEVAIAPDNLRINAALGRLDRLRALVASDGTLAPAAGEGRGFYRIHSGFPTWRPSNERQEILDEALVWAARAGQIDSMEFLVARGANVNADPYRGSPLLAATGASQLDAMRWLLDHGADVNQRATFGGPSYGTVTALHVCAEGDRLEAARLLLDRGADPSIKDLVYSGDAAGWAGHNKSAQVAALLAERATAR